MLFSPPLCLLAALVIQSPDPPSPPGESGEAWVAALAELERQGMDDKGPGAILASAHGGQVQVLGSIGRADRRSETSIGAETLFASPSIAKQIVCALAWTLALEGRIDLDMHLGDALLEFRTLQPQPTLRQVMEHSSGLRDVYALLGARRRGEGQFLDRKAALHWASRQHSPLFRPGTKTGVTPTNDLLLAELIVRTEGRSLDEVASEVLFGPIGMATAEFAAERAEGSEATDRNRAKPYVESLISWREGPGQGRIVGDRGLWLSASDLALWGAELLSPRVLPPEVAAGIRTGSYSHNDQEVQLYRGSNLRTWRGQPVSQLVGMDSGFGTTLLLYPEQGWVLAGLCNHSAGFDLLEASKAAMGIQLADVLDPPSKEQRFGGRFREDPRHKRSRIPDFSVGGLPGRYQLPELDLVLVLRADGNGALQCSIDGRPELQALPSTSQASGPHLALGSRDRNEIKLEPGADGRWTPTTLDWTPRFRVGRPLVTPRLTRLVLERVQD